MFTTKVVGDVGTSIQRPSRARTCKPPGTSSPLSTVKAP